MKSGRFKYFAERAGKVRVYLTDARTNRILYNGTMKIDDLLNATEPLLYETGAEEWPYAFAGSCFPVKYRDRSFIISAYHCYENFQIQPEQTLYPRPDDSAEFLAFECKSRAECLEADDKEHFDQAILHVSREHHSSSEMKRLVALDLSVPKAALLPTDKRIKDMYLRGYPFDAPKHGIDYDKLKITKQAYTTNGLLSTNSSPFDFCYLIKLMTPIPAGLNPKGISGSPIYGITHQNDIVYCGTVIRHSRYTGEYLVIGPEIIVNALKNL